MELEAEWMALCDLAVVPVEKVCFSPCPSTLCAIGMTTTWNDGPNNSKSCYDIIQRSPISVFWAAGPSDKMSTTLNTAGWLWAARAKVWESADTVMQLIWWTRTQYLQHMVEVCVVHERSTSRNQSDFKSLKAICADDSCSHKNWTACVCAPVDLEVLFTVARKQKTLPNGMAGRLPALNWLKSLELERGLRCGKVFLESWGSSYAWITLHPGCATTRSECDWHFMGAYCSHPACQSKPLECFGMFFLASQPVFIILWGTTLL